MPLGQETHDVVAVRKVQTHFFSETFPYSVRTIVLLLASGAICLSYWLFYGNVWQTVSAQKPACHPSSAAEAAVSLFHQSILTPCQGHEVVAAHSMNRRCLSGAPVFLIPSVCIKFRHTSQRRFKVIPEKRLAAGEVVHHCWTEPAL